MKTPRFVRAISCLLVVAIMAPTAFLLVPPKANAEGSSVSCIGGVLGSIAGNAASTATSVPNNSWLANIISSMTAGSTIGTCVYQVIILPLIRAAIRKIIQNMTASVIDWINGKKNGTGKPSFVGSLTANLQLVGDNQALSFFAQFARNSNSPFVSSIVASLRTSYLQNTSAAGFWAANRSTLSQYSPNVNSFLAGNWSQGGVGAWLALTTQSANNPYLLYQASQSQLGSLVASAQAVRTTSLNWGQGFLSWCGPVQSTTVDTSTAEAARAACKANGNSDAQCQDAYQAYMNAAGASVTSGDSCKNSDGTSGTTRTPGSVIHDYTQKFVVSVGADQLVAASDLDSAFNAIIGALLNRVLGGVGGGLLTTGTTATQLRNYVPVSNNSASSTSTTVDDVIARITSYTNSWTTIKTAVDAASAGVSGAIQACSTSNGNNVTMLQVALPAITQTQADTQAALDKAATASTFAVQVKNEANTAASSYAADLITLINMPPTIAEIGAAQELAKITGRAKADPANSFNISGGTPVDQMNLMAQTAANYALQCGTVIQ